MNKPDYSQVFVNQYRWQPQYDRYVLSPGGYLIAVAIHHAPESGGTPLVNPDRDVYWRGSFSLRGHYDDVSADPIAILNWRYELSQCGVAFPNPVPDMNHSMPLVLKRDAPTKTDAVLLVTTVHVSFL